MDSLSRLDVRGDAPEEDTEKAACRLEALFELMQSDAGTEEGWATAVAEGLPQRLMATLQASPMLPRPDSATVGAAESASMVRLNVACLGCLFMCASVDPSCWTGIADAVPDAVAVLLERGTRALAHARVTYDDAATRGGDATADTDGADDGADDGENSYDTAAVAAAATAEAAAQKQLVVLVFLEALLGATEAARLALPTGRGRFNAAFLVRTVLDAVAGGGVEAVFLAATRVALALNEQSFTGSHKILRELRDHPARSSVQEALLHIFNAEGFPANNDVVAAHCIHFCQDVLEASGMEDFFYVNDIKMMVDIVIRECLNRPMADKLRHEYLGLLRQVAERSSWAAGGERHRFDDIVEMLENTLRAVALAAAPAGATADGTSGTPPLEAGTAARGPPMDVSEAVAVKVRKAAEDALAAVRQAK
ncbi:unnamed protein product [Phaeothamnion confervicola]